jgi:hypothetical protein
MMYTRKKGHNTQHTVELRTESYLGTLYMYSTWCSSAVLSAVRSAATWASTSTLRAALPPVGWAVVIT